jgi:hypothetical protein
MHSWSQRLDLNREPHSGRNRTATKWKRKAGGGDSKFHCARFSIRVRGDKRKRLADLTNVGGDRKCQSADQTIHQTIGSTAKHIVKLPTAQQLMKENNNATDGAKSDDYGVLGRLGQAVAFIGGAATAVYLTGGLLLALRLFFERLPSQAVIGQLPRELLITIGLTNVASPALLIGAIYTVIRLHRGPRVRPSRIRRWGPSECSAETAADIGCLWPCCPFHTSWFHTRCLIQKGP